MSLPNLRPDGFLPPGLHLVNLDEIKRRFGQETLQRQALFERLQLFVELANYVQARRLFVNGSYVTAKPNPGDVDVVIWVGEHFLHLLEANDDQALSLETMFLTRQPKRRSLCLMKEAGWIGLNSFRGCGIVTICERGWWRSD